MFASVHKYKQVSQLLSSPPKETIIILLIYLGGIEMNSQRK